MQRREVELAGEVDVTLLVPGGTEASFFDDHDPQYKPAADAKLNRPSDVGAAVVWALQQPPGCQVRELIVTPSTEPSHP
jgi:NADP-dependent 3-hydroxy acid dehydrogenase YdfG